jgi:hypothetical protein
MFKNLKIAFLLTVCASCLIYCIQKDHKTEAVITIAIQPFGYSPRGFQYVEKKVKVFTQM